MHEFGPEKLPDNAGDGADEGRLAENILYFARTLRGAGMRIGTAAMMDAVRAVETCGISSRDDFYWTLHCVMVNRHEDHVVFDEAFRLFWRSRDLIEKMLQMFSPVANPTRAEERRRAAQSRVSQSLFADEPSKREIEKPQVEVDAVFTASQREILRRKDFAQMSVDELAIAREELSRLVLPFGQVKTRRLKPVNALAKSICVPPWPIRYVPEVTCCCRNFKNPLRCRRQLLFLRIFPGQ